MARTTRFKPWAFALASMAAPGLSVVVFLVGGAVVQWLQPGPVGLPPAGSVGLALVLVTFWGWIPSAVFGGAVLGLSLAYVPAFARKLPAVAGALAAAAYVLTGLGTFAVRPGLTYWFAPWAVDGSNPGDPLYWTIPASIVVAGGLAGTIYARLADRG